MSVDLSIDYEKVVEEMIEIGKRYDTEGGHAMADDLLCKFLRSLGYDDLVDEFEKLDKWYG